MNRSKLLALAFFLLPTMTGLAETLQEPDHLSVFHAKNGKVHERKILYKDVKPDLTFSGMSPHKNLNPEGKISEWSGLGFKGLLKGAGTGSPDEEITVVASNEYRSQFFRKDLAGEPEAMVAFYENGNRLDTRRGGAQTMFATTHPKHPPILTFDGYGVWFVTAILVGQLPTTIEVQSGTKEETINLAGAKGETRKERMFGPVGHCRTPDRICTPQNQLVTIAYQNLSKVLAGKNPARVSVDTFHSKRIPLGANWHEYEVITAWDGKPISPKFGGPIQICPKNKVINCVFFARKLLLEN